MGCIFRNFLHSVIRLNKILQFLFLIGFSRVREGEDVEKEERKDHCSAQVPNSSVRRCVLSSEAREGKAVRCNGRRVGSHCATEDGRRRWSKYHINIINIIEISFKGYCVIFGMMGGELLFSEFGQMMIARRVDDVIEISVTSFCKSWKSSRNGQRPSKQLDPVNYPLSAFW